MTYDSKADKFDKRLSLVRQAWRGSHRREDRKDAGGEARLALASIENPISDVSFYEFYSKYYWKRSPVKKRAQPVALQIAPNFSADCAEVDHGLHQMYARANVLAFWRLMKTNERFKLVIEARDAVDTRTLGSTLLDLPPVHAGGEPSHLDRFLGLSDLEEAFERGLTRREFRFHGTRDWREHTCRKRPRNCDWAFALMEMLLDPVLVVWVPKWVVEQYERRNPAFRVMVDKELRQDKKNLLSNRQLLSKVRRALLSDAKRRKDEATRVAAAAKGQEDDGQSGSHSSDSSGGGRSDSGLKEGEGSARGRMIREAMPGDDDFDGDEGCADGNDEEGGAWAKRSAEERASAAAPAPVLSDFVVPPRLRCFVQGVSINPENHDWAADNVLSMQRAKQLKALSDAWCKEAAGGMGEYVDVKEMDPEQRFAYKIHEYKIDERETMESQGSLSKYRALRMILTGPPGAGKSRTVRSIAMLRGQRARARAEKEARQNRVSKDLMLKRSQEAARGACLLAAPTGTASFQIKAGATTLHRLFGIPIGTFRSNSSTEALVRRTRILKASSLIALDEFSMIGRKMLGKMKYRVEEALGAESADVGVLKSMGGKDVMLSGDPDQTAPIGDDSLHREGASKKDGVQGTRDARGRPKKPPEDAVDAWVLSDSGLAFFHEFDDVVLLEQRHRLVDPEKENIAEGRKEAFVDDLTRFREVCERLAELTITREEFAWLSRRNRSRLSAEERRLFDEAVLLMDTRKQRVERGGEVTQLDGADYKNLEELYKLAARKGVPIVRFGSHHKEREGEETMKAELMEDDDFGLAAELQMCVGAQIILRRNMWIGAGLVNGSMGTVRHFVWEPGGDPTSLDPRWRAPYCIIVEFDDVQLNEMAVDGDGKPYVVNRRRFF